MFVPVLCVDSDNPDLNCCSCINQHEPNNTADSAVQNVQGKTYILFISHKLLSLLCIIWKKENIFCKAFCSEENSHVKILMHVVYK